MQNQAIQPNVSDRHNLRVREEILAAAISDTRPCEGGGFERTFQLPPSFSGFDGHFPTDPIVPGVVQLLMVHASVADHMQQPLTLVRAKSVKFLDMIRPDDSIRVAWTLQPKDGQLRCKATLTVRQTVAASLTLLFTGQTEACHAS